MYLSLKLKFNVILIILYRDGVAYKYVRNLFRGRGERREKKYLLPISPTRLYQTVQSITI